ncbi:MAG: hypothetical protein ACOCXJ_02210 [Planctomycetota bacterium]
MSPQTTHTTASYIWTDAEAFGRNVYAIFRRDLHLEAVPETALINLFADARYRLRVNGLAIAHGPARFAPQAPEFDSVDLAPYLEAGDNVITVEVNGYGSRSSERVSGGRSGFIAWGTIGDTDLATPGDWRARPANDAWDAHAFKFSFIQQAIEVCDTRRLDPAWFEPGASLDDGWQMAVPLAHQQEWGALIPRSVPDYKETIDRPMRIDLISRLDDAEQRIGCRVYDPLCDGLRDQHEARSFAYVLWLHSERAQTARIGLFWGDNHLNGQLIAQHDEPERGDRQYADLALRAGWNLLYGEMALLQDVWSVTLGIPRSAGISVRAEPDLACSQAMRHSAPMATADLPSRQDLVPADADALAALPLEWTTVAWDDPSPQPSRMIRWDQVAQVEAEDQPVHLPISLPLDEHRQWGLSLDMGQEFHGRLRLELEAPAGTVCDVLYEEQRRPDGLPGRLGFAFCDPADSYVLRGGRQLIEGFHDRGGRLIHLSLRAPEGTSSGTIRVHAIGIRSCAVPIADRGWFRCSDPLYDWAWQASAATVRVCQMDVFLPDAWRERGMAVADNRFSTPLNRVLDSDMRVSRRSVGMYRHGLGHFPGAEGMLNAYMPACPTGPLSDFALMWHLWVEDHWNLTGDDELVRDCLPSMEAILNGSVWQTGDSGLWHGSPIKPFVDWGATTECQSADENGALNIMRYAATSSLARLCDQALGDQERAAHWRAQADRIWRAIEERLWIDSEGRYAIGTRDGVRWDEPSAPHVAVLALRFGAPSTNQRERLFAYLEPFIRDNLHACLRLGEKRQGNFQMLFLHYVLEILYDLGEAGLAEAFIRDHWGEMRRRGAWTTWERLGPTLPSSQCHVWSSTPLIHACQHVLGIRQRHPAREDAYVIEPIAEDIDWAAGAYPLTEGGEIRVHWRVAQGILHLRVEAPEHLDISIAPRGRLGRLPRRVARVTPQMET